MKKTLFLFLLLVIWASILAASDSCLVVDWQDEFAGISLSDLRDHFLGSDSWSYGLSADGLPFGIWHFSCPAGWSVAIDSIQMEKQVSEAPYDIDDLRWFDQTTDAEGLATPVLGDDNLKVFGFVKGQMERRFSNNGNDYYNLLIMPFQYDSASSELTVVTKLKVWISLRPGGERSYGIGSDFPAMDLMLQKLDPTSRVIQSLLSGQPKLASGYLATPNYIIITNAALAGSFEPFVLWKRALGYNCQIKLIEEIESEETGIDSAEKVREYLRQAYANGLEWLLIGGDETIVPVRRAYPANTNEQIPADRLQATDLYYSDLTGIWEVDGDGVWGEPAHDHPDLQPEIFVGRVPANDPAEVQNWAKKTIDYEKGTVLGVEGFAEKILITSADQMRDWNEGQGQDSSVAAAFPAEIPVNRTSMAEWPSGDDPSPSHPHARSFIETYSEGWNLAIVLAHGACGGFVTMSSGYNQWPKTYVWVGSGADPLVGYMDDLTNADRSGIIYSVACSQGGFDMDQPPINSGVSCAAEGFLNLENRGACAFIGYSRYGWVASSYRLAEKFVEYLYNADNRLGPANAYSKLYYATFRDLNYGLNLFGDPALAVWTHTPLQLQISHPQVISLGENIFNVQVSVNGQAVESTMVTVISKEANLFIGYTDAAGNLGLSFNSPLDTGVVLTASKTGLVPMQVNLSTSIILDAGDDEGDQSAIPSEFALHQNYPNPANPATTIGFDLPRSGDVEFEFFNILGQQVRQESLESVPAGKHDIDLDLSGLPSGIYFYRLTTVDNSDTKKLMLLK